MQEVIFEQVCLSVLIGCALSLAATAALARPFQPAVSSILSRLLLIGAPAYLAIDYLFSLGPVIVACAGMSFAFGLCGLRRWWLPEHLPGADLRSFGYRASAFLGLAGDRRRVAVASDTLRYRIEAVVHADRRREERASNGPMANAA